VSTLAAHTTNSQFHPRELRNQISRLRSVPITNTTSTLGTGARQDGCWKVCCPAFSLMSRESIINDDASKLSTARRASIANRLPGTRDCPRARRASRRRRRTPLPAKTGTASRYVCNLGVGGVFVGDRTDVVPTPGSDTVQHPRVRDHPPEQRPPQRRRRDPHLDSNCSLF
jgi:hypothetical protein